MAIFIAIVYLAIKYRHGRPEDRPRPHPEQLWILEVAWIVIPLVLTMVMFVWGAVLYFEIRTPPDGRHRAAGRRQAVDVEDLPSAGPQRDQRAARAGGPAGAAADDLRGCDPQFFVPAFRVKMDVLPGRYTTMWFEATKPGEYHLFCAEYCGTEHADMRGRVVVMSPADYAEWLAEGDARTVNRCRREAVHAVSLQHLP